MRRIIIVAVTIVLLLSNVLTMMSCNSPKKEIESLISRFEIACNELDFEGALDCINPKTADGIKVGAGILGLFSDATAEEMFVKLAGLLTKGDINDSSFFSSLDIEIDSISIDEEKASVEALVTFEMSGTNVIREATIKCVYYADRWYISDFSFN